MSDVNKQVTQTLAEAFNLLAQAELNGLRGAQVRTAGRQIEAFQAVIQALSDGQLEVIEVGNAPATIVAEEDADAAI